MTEEAFSRIVTRWCRQQVAQSGFDNLVVEADAQCVTGFQAWQEGGPESWKLWAATRQVDVVVGIRGELGPAELGPDVGKSVVPASRSS